MRRLPCALCVWACIALLFCLPGVSQAFPRVSGTSGDALSLAMLQAAGAQPMTQAEALAFLFKDKGRLHGDIGHWRDTLWLFSDGTLKGETSGHYTTADPAAGKWSLDEDGTLHLFVNWRYGGKQDSVGRLYIHEGHVYQMDGQDVTRSWLYRFKM